MDRIYKKLIFAILALAAILFVSSSVHAQNIITGNATSGSEVDNSINTNDSGCGCSPTPTHTPTPTLTPTPTEVTPTLTPTLTPTPTEVTPTPTNTPSNPGNPGGPGDGRSDGRSDGLSSCPSCTQAPQQGQVLGASTFAGTGTFDSTLAAFEEILGIAMSSAGAILVYGKKTKLQGKK